MPNLLLVSVFKPYGVDDIYGDSLCSMELLSNQVTREQGIHSPRSNNPSYGLYLLAENVRVPTTVLDFPDWDEFVTELARGSYTHVGISFIIPNVPKARRMAEHIRRQHPGVRILLGGHGTSIPEIAELVPCDAVCRGEGVAWLRRYFGEATDRPIRHPTLPTHLGTRLYGVPIPGKAGVLIPGVGCQNACSFCATSHKFERRYTPFLRTGEEMFAACRNAEKELGVTDFGVLDENFCQTPLRARQLLAAMERAGKAYTFSIFSSADAVQRLGVDFLVRLGVNFVWIGVESKANVFQKTQGVDLARLIDALQAHGISVLASIILFLDHHDRQTIQEEIDWAIGLRPDLLQFMELGPSPGTRLYQDYAAAGRLLRGVPWQAQHGQGEIWFSHPSFTPSESARLLKQAFVRNYRQHGPGVLHLARTALQGYLALRRQLADNERLGRVWDPETLAYRATSGGEAPRLDPFLRLRLETLRQNAVKFRPVLGAMEAHAPTAEIAREVHRLAARFLLEFGEPSLGEHALGLAVRAAARLEEVRRRLSGGVVMRQPRTLRRRYPLRQVPAPVALPEAQPEQEVAAALSMRGAGA